MTTNWRKISVQVGTVKGIGAIKVTFTSKDNPKWEKRKRIIFNNLISLYQIEYWKLKINEETALLIEIMEWMKHQSGNSWNKSSQTKWSYRN